MTVFPLGALAGLLVGAIMGSFLSTLALRWPDGRGVARGRSACDHCGVVLRAHELIPLLSGLIQRGRCRQCGGAIDPLHGRMEWACGIIGAAAFGSFPPLPGLGWAALGWMLLPLAILDWRHFWLPDRLTLPLAFLGFTLGGWTTDVAMEQRVIGAIIGYGGLMLIAFGYRRLRGREGLGLGDAKLLGALGAWLGALSLPFILLTASGAALLVLVVQRAGGRRIEAASAIPLGTFLCVGAVPGYAFSVWLIGPI